MSFISFIISQAKSCFSILIKIKLFFPFFLSSFDTSWQKYGSEEHSHPGAGWSCVTPAKHEARWWQLKTPALETVIATLSALVSNQEEARLWEDVCHRWRRLQSLSLQPWRRQQTAWLRPHPTQRSHQLTMHLQKAGKHGMLDANSVTNQNNLFPAGSFQVAERPAWY